jgi:hypothetical protein
MNLVSMASTDLSIRATQGRLMVAVVAATFLALALTIVVLAIGGRPDPPRLRAAVTVLDGTWRFHTGDDPHWADPGMDDHGWQAIDMTAAPGSHDGDVGLPDYVAGWMARGHPGYHGYAWYRRHVDVPAGSASWEILGPTLVEDGYELYWNGKLLGGSGRIGPRPRVVGTRPLRYALPGDAAGTEGVIAIRTYMLPGSGSSQEGGGMHTPPILAPQPASTALHHAQWARTIAGYVVDVVEPIGMLALVGLAVGYWARSRRRAFLAFACVALVLTAARRLDNAIVSWTDLQALTTYATLAAVLWAPATAAWVLAWNRWPDHPWHVIDALAIALAVVGGIGALDDIPGWVIASRFGSISLFAIITARMILRAGPRYVLAPATLLVVVAGLFGGELLDPLGIPGIWFPFGIGVSRTQFIYAIGIPLLGLVMATTLGRKRTSVRNTAGAVT